MSKTRQENETDSKGVPSGQWASGRVLTSAQRHRKRAKDRITSQKRRTETQDEIARLRDHVAELARQVEILERRAETTSPLRQEVTAGSMKSTSNPDNTSDSGTILCQTQERAEAAELLTADPFLQRPWLPSY